jgi:hypothetical protein
MAIIHIVLLFPIASKAFTALTIYLYVLSMLWLAAGSVTKLQIYNYLYTMTYVLEITTVIVLLVNIGIVFAVWDSLYFIEILCDIIYLISWLAVTYVNFFYTKCFGLGILPPETIYDRIFRIGGAVIERVNHDFAQKCQRC